ncbi:nucleotidyl transferase AbiEii/AbiGii toxin family protein [Halanaerobium sp. ST460_2HS_T2]|jgi:predicted nucleotidyltransferase component of viral defense system|uniref:nucleotidyl transferase AbiEii/AbiGii toxin family protein n=1 Tax=Halanaerobium sp. ST460_2HS_T2 TaxID=2183914 RepID=UPI000DF3B42F|nr:nucleotidyl transferase AbiEii/AbiGii toxin family protein [Halanaerobium sp. ST460_2HS_T2]RCW60332.1 putative nucleotidyltransferase component of viral defense system [Halanaerobium sp. ST460_2HS_T2]
MSKNLAASVLGRLKNISKELNIPFNLAMQLYAQERFLYRLSKSEYNDNFLLKGGLLLYSMDQFKGRPTKDIDFLLKKQDNNSANIEKIIKKIMEINVEDGISFDLNKIKSRAIIEGADYKGQRIKIIAMIGNARVHLQIDIGFGDIVVPKPEKIKYPGLLDFDEPEIIAYSLETVIAEKFDAMVSLALLNSRMKDFYDIFKLMSKKQYEAKILRKSIKKTFKKRDTQLDAELIIFSEQFKNDTQKNRQWQLFLKRIKEEDLSFTYVINNIEDFLRPIYVSILQEEEINSTWDPEKLRWFEK